MQHVEDGNITDQTPYLRDRDHKWETVQISITQPESEVDPRNLEMIKLMSDLAKLTNQKFVDLLMNDDCTFSQSSYEGLEKLLQHSGLSEKYSSFHFPDNIKSLCDKIASLEWKIKHGPTYEEELLDKKAEEIARKLFDSRQLRGVFQRSDSAAYGRNTDYFISEIIVDGVTYEVSTATNTTTTPTQHNVKSFFKGVTRKFVSRN